MHIAIFCSYNVLSLQQLKLTSDTQMCQQDTPSFQFKGQLTAMDWGAGADIYAFGGVAVELLGKAVWESLHPYQIITKVYDQCLLCAKLCIISEL